MLLREGHIGQHFCLGLVHKGRELENLWSELVGDLPPVSLGGGFIILGEGGAHEDRDKPTLALAGLDHDFAHSVGRVEHQPVKFAALRRESCKSAFKHPVRTSADDAVADDLARGIFKAHPHL